MPDSNIQSIRFDKKYWTIEKAHHWLEKNHKHPIKAVHETANEYRFRTHVPDFHKYRIKSLPDHIKLVIGFNE